MAMTRARGTVPGGNPLSDMSSERLKSVIEEYWASGEAPVGCSVIHRRSKGRGALLRVDADGAGSFVVKAWIARNLRERCKQVAGLSSGRREWRSHRSLHASGLVLPRPIAYQTWATNESRFEAFAIEDLGPTTKALKVLKASVRQQHKAEVARLETAVILMTKAMISAGFSDEDHQLNNIVMAGDGQLFRLDVECARHWPFGRIPDRALGVMIGRLVASHAFACQPHLSWSEDFALRLASALSASPSALRCARAEVHEAMERQRQRNGTDSRLSLAW
ncbi:MAG: hypothetical protein JJT88_12375 [Gammaproteobacteria bacterium]|nr:hypothetical protein [Gammaproteobacteria bacterium]